MGLVGSYLSALFSLFFRWWWAAVTGVFTIIGVLMTPMEV